MGNTESHVFGPGFVRFLKQLEKNNDKTWFRSNKQRFEEEVQTPFLAFIGRMRDEFARFAPCIEADDRKVGGSMFRIYRDTRFAKDKSPYKSWMAARFHHVAGKKADAPGFYLRIGTNDVVLGAGVWRPEAPALHAIRQHIVDEPAAWKRACGGKAFVDTWTEEHGERLKRVPRGFPSEGPHVEDLKRRDFVFLCPMPLADVTERDFAKRAARAYKRTDKFMAFLAEALDVDW